MLDHFKLVNDRHGHQAGDRLLKAAASAWRDQIRSGDLLARYGGEEFAVLLPGCSGPNAAMMAERLRAATPEGATVSVGLAVRDPGESAEQLVARADRALYDAKRHGRDQVSLAGPLTP